MFIVLLRFSANKSRAGAFMQGHNDWLQRGFDDGIFLLAGSLPPGQGGSVIAHNCSLPDLQQRINEDPFVVEDVVRAEILEIHPSKVDPRWAFLEG